MPYINVGSSPNITTTHRGTPRFKKAIDGSRSGAHREQGCSSRCGCAFHMHAALRRPPVYVISMQNRLARNLTPGYTIAHDRRHQGAKRMVEFTGAMWWWLLWRISRLLTTLSMLSWSIHCINSHNSSQELHAFHILTESWNGPRTG